MSLISMQFVLKRNDVIVEYLLHGKNGRFAKMIFYFLRAGIYAECKVKLEKKLIFMMARECK